MMNESSNNEARASRALFLVVTIAAASFAILWLTERQHKPAIIVKEVPQRVEVLKKVPVEIIKEVPIEKIKKVTNEVEVPAKLTEVQQAALEFSSNYVTAPSLATMDDALYKLDSISVRINLKDDLKRVISDQLLKDRYEAILRGYNIRTDDRSPYWLGVNYDSLWSVGETSLVYGVHMELYDSVILDHKDDLRRTYAIVWAHDFLGTADRETAAQVLLSTVDTNADFFARRFVTIQDRSR